MAINAGPDVKQEDIFATLELFPARVRHKLYNSVASWSHEPLLKAQELMRDAGYWPSEIEHGLCTLIDRWNEYETQDHMYRMERLIYMGIDYHVPIDDNAPILKNVTIIKTVKG